MVTEAFHPFMEYWWPHGHIIGWEHAQVHTVYHFIDCVVNNKDVEPYGASFKDGYRCLVVEEGIAESARKGQRIFLKYEA